MKLFKLECLNTYCEADTVVFVECVIVISFVSDTDLWNWAAVVDNEVIWLPILPTEVAGTIVLKSVFITLHLHHHKTLFSAILS